MWKGAGFKLGPGFSSRMRAVMRVFPQLCCHGFKAVVFWMVCGALCIWHDVMWAVSEPQIGESLKRFGVSEGCSSLLVARFDAADGDVSLVAHECLMARGVWLPCAPLLAFSNPVVTPCCLHLCGHI